MGRAWTEGDAAAIKAGVRSCASATKHLDEADEAFERGDYVNGVRHLVTPVATPLLWEGAKKVAGAVAKKL